MVELVNGMDFHNFNLDCKPKEWFKRNKEKETLEELVGFDLNLKGSHNFTLSELKSLEIYTNLDLCSLKNI